MAVIPPAAEAGPHPYKDFQKGAALMEAALKGSARRVPIYAQMHEFVARQAGIPGEVIHPAFARMVQP